MTKYDITIIGSGPGGYVAAIRCAQLGMKTAIIEKYDALGGTCLNVGCIPSKAMLDSTELVYKTNHEFEVHGIKTEKVSVDLAQMVKRKAEVVKANTDGVAFLMKKNKVDVHHGVGSFITKNKIGVAANEKSTEIETDKVIIATGSKPATATFITIDKKRIITSTEALNITDIPKSMVVIGGGYIGCEMGSVFARLGTEVTVLEFMDSLIPGMDADLGRELNKVLMKQGMKVLLKHKVKEVKPKGNSVTVKADDESGKELFVTADYCLVAVGRKPFTEGLGLDKVGIKTDDKGRIPVDDHLKTAVDGIYAIGDVIRGAMLAHKSEDEGVFVAEVIAGQKPHIDYNLIPGVVYTWPEVAAVGQSEQQLTATKREYKKGKFFFKASGRARASGDLDGFIKVLADKSSDEILGVHMIGPRAADMIAEAVVAMEFRASAEDIARMSHAHPTYTESFREACLDATGKRALNA